MVGNNCIRKLPRRVCALSAFVLFAFLLCACGNKTSGIRVTTVLLQEDGSLTHVVVEDFSADYYDVDELKAQVEEEVSSYNTRLAEERIKMTACKREGDDVRLVMTYASGDDYAAFNRVVFSYDVSEHSVTIAEPMHVRTVKKITEVTDGVEILSDKEAAAGEDTTFPATIKTEE